MIIKHLTQRDKDEIQAWEYSGEYTVFNYALKEDGWLDKYCCTQHHYCYREYSGEYTAFNYALKEDGWLDKYCCTQHHYCYSIEVENTLVGLFMFIEKNNNEFRVLINPEQLSKGYGKLITNAAIEMAFEELRFSKISLIVRQNHAVGIKLYEKLGFKRVGETTQMLNGEEVDFYEMLKSKTP